LGSKTNIKVLVVDDSLVFREGLARGISSDPEITVVAKAVDRYDAKDKILKFKPDVMTCDVEMPKMNGVEFIRQLLPQYKIPIIVVSSVNEAVFDALNAGAVDFIAKPKISSSSDIEDFINVIIQKIKAAANAKINLDNKNSLKNLDIVKPVDYNKIVAIGASTGGTEALSSLLSSLPPTMPGIVIVQHIPPLFSKMFADRLNSQLPLTVKEAENGDYIEPGKVYIAPGDKHMSIKKIGKRYKINVFPGERVNGHCPSVDVLFESVAKEAGKDAIGIILTGMGQDGARGLLKMRQNGARTIGQNEATCVVYGMPKVAYDIGGVETQLGLNEIPGHLMKILEDK